MDKDIDIDKVIVNTAELDPAEFEYPMVKDTPEGWPGLKAIGGITWYQRALKTEAATGRKVLPSKYTYDDDGNVIINPNYQPNVECEDGDCKEENGTQEL